MTHSRPDEIAWLGFLVRRLRAALRHAKNDETIYSFKDLIVEVDARLAQSLKDERPPC